MPKPVQLKGRVVRLIKLSMTAWLFLVLATLKGTTLEMKPITIDHVDNQLFCSER